MSNEWRVQAKAMLSEGYGVEDIAVRLTVDVEDVRHYVRALRATSKLKDVLFGRRYRGQI